MQAKPTKENLIFDGTSPAPLWQNLKPKEKLLTFYISNIV